jgi:hypothetical protein
MEIQHRRSDGRGEFFIEAEGERLALMAYSVAGEKRIIIDHTEVSDKLRGTGAGKKLVAAGAAYARENGIRIVPLCPFAKAVMEKSRDDYADVLDR